MFVGHYGVSFAARRTGVLLPLWVWFLAVQWLDVVFAVLVLAGVEKVRITPDFTEANSLDLYYMPFTHSLPGSLVLSAIFAAVITMIWNGARARTFLVVAAACFSHWLLDLVVHTHDLPLYDNSAKVGLGLWENVAISFPLELAVLAVGAWLYSRSVNLTDRTGRVVIWAFVALMAVAQVFANFGPALGSPEGFAVSALVGYAVLAALAALVERRAVGAHGR
ncbi:MAG: hypothetical protein ACR2FE_12205 [Aeromicrobium sp.]